MDLTDPRRFDVNDHPLLNKTVVHPETGKPVKVTRCITTRFGVLAQLDGQCETAYLPSKLKEVR